METLFGGRVAKRTLPLVAPGQTNSSLMLKRLLLPQGNLDQFHDGGEMRYIAVIALLAGTTRGNHYHLHKEETIYLHAGEFTLHLLNTSTSETATINVREGDMVTIGTGIAHALEVTVDGFAVECSPAAFDAADSHPCPVKRRE